MGFVAGVDCACVYECVCVCVCVCVYVCACVCVCVRVHESIMCTYVDITKKKKVLATVN